MKQWIPVLLLCLLLSGCARGNPLPEGMDAEEVIAAGTAVVKQAGDGEYAKVLSQFREDVREELTVERLQALIEDATAGCGDYVQVEDAMATGQESDGEEYGVAVLYAEYTEGDVLYRVAFDPDMALIGLSVGET